MDYLINTAAETWRVTNEMAPYLLLGFFMAGLLSVIFKPDTIKKHLGAGSFLPVVKATLFGVPLPLCSCGVIPVTASLKNSGAGRGPATAFLISTPQTGVDSFLVTYSLLGPIFTVFRPLVALIGGVLGGVLVNRFIPEEEEKALSQNMEQGARKRGLATKLKEIFVYGFITMPKSIGAAVLVGLVIAGIITALIPDEWFMAFESDLVAIPAMMLLGIPIYVCSTASVPVAAALMAKGVSPGAAMVFLMTGPATNAAAIATMWKVLGKGSAIIYLITCGITAIGAGIALDLLFPSLGDSYLTDHGAHHEDPASPLETASAIVLGLVIGYGIYVTRIKPLFSKTPETGSCCSCNKKD